MSSCASGTRRGGRSRSSLLRARKVEKVMCRAQPDVVVLESGTVCEFEVFVTPHCTYSIHDILVATGTTIGKESFNVQVNFRAETTTTTLLHCDDIVTAKQIAEWSLGMVYEGKSGEWLRSR